MLPSVIVSHPQMTEAGLHNHIVLEPALRFYKFIDGKSTLISPRTSSLIACPAGNRGANAHFVSFVNQREADGSNLGATVS
jgi:hypothetical protein